MVMRRLVMLLILSTAALAAAVPGGAAQETIVLHASTVLDGRGATLADRDVVVRDGLIVGIVPGGQGRGDVRYELGDLTLMPGLIDTHVHIGWHFDRATGMTHSGQVEESPEDEALYAAANAWTTLRGGVTTVLSLGAPIDIPLRESIENGLVPGPRLLTSVRAVNARTGGPDELRAHVARMAGPGAAAPTGLHEGIRPRVRLRRRDLCQQVHRGGSRREHGPSRCVPALLRRDRRRSLPRGDAVRR